MSRKSLTVIFLFSILATSFGKASEFLFQTRDAGNSLLYDLEIARYWDEKMEERLPLTFNHLLSTGYFTTPSARMGEEGEISIGVASVPPYNLINGRLQLFSHLELSGNYRIFKGVKDPGLSPRGFGDYADRGANLKFALFTPEEMDEWIPGLAFGVEDFIGSKKFTNYYVVATEVVKPIGLEASLGWGWGRYSGHSQGFFGGASWFPFWRGGLLGLEPLAFAIEYDPIDYSNPKKEPHPDGRVVHSSFNYGLKWAFSDLLYFTASRIRGDDYAVSGAFNYNWGAATGFLPKVRDPLPYIAPRDTEPIGYYRPEAVMIQSLNFAFEEQGFFLTKAWLEQSMDEMGCLKQTLWISVMNQRYRQEYISRDRIQYLLSALTPSNVSKVVVIMESYGLPCQQYIYTRELLERFACKCISPFEFDLLTPRLEAEAPCSNAHPIFYQRLDPWRLRVSPRLETFFGSSKGKFKYDFGLKAELDGFLPYDIFYELQLSYTLLSTVNDVGDFDFYNPSQLPNVLTDYVNYRKKRVFSTDRAYLQKNWNLGNGWFTKAAGGYFQVNYAGLAGETLYYPANWNFAIGVEGAVLKKRRYNGLWFQSSLRVLEGYTPTYRHYSTLQQFFFNFYYDIPEWKIASKVGVGKFLAYDTGARFELTRYFESGLRISGWLTYTNAGDTMHGESYYNRGIAIELPLDLFSRGSSRRVWNYGLAAWLRDAGAFIPTGRSLFEIVNRERRN